MILEVFDANFFYLYYLLTKLL